MGKKKKGKKKMNFEKVYEILSDARKSKNKPVKSAAESASVFTGGYAGYSCHKGAKLAFTDPTTGQKYYGGGYSRDFDRVPDTILIALDDIVVDTVIVGNVPNLPRSFVDTIFIKWADYTAPIMEKSDWLQLLLALQATGKDVSIACMGGHGRTGTALAILGYFSGAITDKPIQFIQKNYCQEAVESYAQYEYVLKITDVDEMGGAPITNNKWGYVPIAQSKVFINDFKPDGTDVVECKSCGREMFGEEAIYLDKDPFCEFCVNDGKAEMDMIESCALCGVPIDSSVDILYVIGGNSYCQACGEDIKE